MKNSRADGGIGFLGVLQIVFIVLKLTHVIDWPWVWVLAPDMDRIGSFLGHFDPSLRHLAQNQEA